jgi:endoglucanase
VPYLNRTGRRVFLAQAASCAAASSITAANAGQATIATEWQAFKDRFLMPDGRIIDTGNGGISHSEGQGWGMLFAGAANDQDSFDRIFAWTASHLARPDDALHIWRYDPSAANPTEDTNNAADGDIFIAWALGRAAQRWGDAALAAAAMAIASDILAKLCVQQSGRWFLLPGISGFASANAMIVNPSYYIMPAFDTLNALAPSDLWAGLRSDALNLLSNGVFGPWRLPPDWLLVGRPDLSLAPAAAWPPRFGFDAIRIPLWLTWAGQMPQQLGAAFAAYWQSPEFPYRPAWIDLQTNEYANFPAPAGMAAVQMLTLSETATELPGVAGAADYYSAALTLLARIARSEIA